MLELLQMFHLVAWHTSQVLTTKRRNSFLYSLWHKYFVFFFLNTQIKFEPERQYDLNWKTVMRNLSPHGNQDDQLDLTPTQV